MACAEMSPIEPETTMPTTQTTGHILGCTYRSAYWREIYTVRALHEDGSVTVYWHGEQRETRHGTPAGRDQVVS